MFSPKITEFFSVHTCTKHSPCFLSQLETFLESEPEEKEALIQPLETPYQLESPVNRLKRAEVQKVINSQIHKKSSLHFLEISGLCNNHDTALRKGAENMIIIMISVINGNRIILKFEDIECISSDRREYSHYVQYCRQLHILQANQ
jgi:hypothetical protein